MLRPNWQVTSITRRAIGICIGLLALLAGMPSTVVAQVVPGDPPGASAILLALAPLYPTTTFARPLAPLCAPQPIRIANDSGGNWAEVTYFDANACVGSGNPNPMPYQAYLKQGQAGAWTVMCQARYSDVPTYAQVHQQCSAMPQAVYHAFFGAG
jgi:hypothetical protein